MCSLVDQAVETGSMTRGSRLCCTSSWSLARLSSWCNPSSQHPSSLLCVYRTWLWLQATRTEDSQVLLQHLGSFAMLCRHYPLRMVYNPAPTSSGLWWSELTHSEEAASWGSSSRCKCGSCRLHWVLLPSSYPLDQALETWTVQTSHSCSRSQSRSCLARPASWILRSHC